jgi:hypothetical protein
MPFAPKIRTSYEFEFSGGVGSAAGLQCLDVESFVGIQNISNITRESALQRRRGMESFGIPLLYAGRPHSARNDA